MTILIQASMRSHSLDILSYMQLFQTSKKSKIESIPDTKYNWHHYLLIIEVITFPTLVVNDTFQGKAQIVFIPSLNKQAMETTICVKGDL